MELVRRISNLNFKMSTECRYISKFCAYFILENKFVEEIIKRKIVFKCYN
jgi:hypothetical protein